MTAGFDHLAHAKEQAQHSGRWAESPDERSLPSMLEVIAHALIAIAERLPEATGEVPPGPCWHDSGVPWLGKNPARSVRCELLAGHAGAHEAVRPQGGTAVWLSEDVQP